MVLVAGYVRGGKRPDGPAALVVEGVTGPPPFGVDPGVCC